MNNKMDRIGVQIPSVLLPQTGIDYSKWAVVACDQYTSQPEYWDEVARLVGDAPSTLRLILPEVYLEAGDVKERISGINRTMEQYLNENILGQLAPCMIYVDRKTSRSESRKGLMLALDLEKYDFTPGSGALIRATEGTVLDRLPPRIKIREDASLELPHIMVLIDDEEKTVIEPLAEKASAMEILYDFDLMMGGMHIKGYKVEEEAAERAVNALFALARPQAYAAKYNVSADKGVLLFAVGDGNHSLASAKGHWDNLKKKLPAGGIHGHPARYALVEVVNVHDAGLKFEPIHRVVFNADEGGLLKAMAEYFERQNSPCRITYSQGQGTCPPVPAPHHRIAFASSGRCGTIEVENPRHTLAVGTLQNFLDEYLASHAGVKVDYIHGDEVVESLCSEKGNMGFYLPAMDKGDLFKTVIKEGVLPRKTFSMGEAEEKRFYLECRKIV